MTADSLPPLICPICRGTDFQSSRSRSLFGLSTSQVQLICPACGTRISQSGGASHPRYQVVSIPPAYSNCAFLFQGVQWSRDELINNGMAIYSDAELAQMVQGDLPVDILEPCEEKPPFQLEEGENLIYHLDHVYFFEERLLAGASRFSFSFRQTVEKWDTVKALSDPKRSNVIETLDSGTLDISTRRYSFFGTNHRIEEPLEKVANVVPFRDGMGILRSNSGKVEYYKGGYHWPLIVAAFRGLIKLASQAE